ncbi:MAG: VOC family protein [Gammaproteobacteria bacterium]
MKFSNLKVLAIDHIVLRTGDMAAMLKFYRDLLGCELERELPELGLKQLRAGSSLIDLVDVDSQLGALGGGPPRQDGRNMDHLCLLVEHRSEAELGDYLRSNGISVPEFADRYGATGHGRSVYIEDPEGNTVELKLAAGAPQKGAF